MKATLTFIIGCTGSGKGGLGRELAKRTGGEIISIDSMKVYRRMDIGTAKPSAETRRQIPHHLIDVVEPSQEYSVAMYVETAEKAIADIHERGKPIFVVGGTPLYVKGLSEGLFEGPGADLQIRERLNETVRDEGAEALFTRLGQIDPEAATRIHRNDLRRIVRALEVFELTGKTITELQTQWDQGRTRHDCVFVGLQRDRDNQGRRTNERVRRMIDAGLVDEVRRLMDEPTPLSETARKAVGYAEIIEHLNGSITLADAVEMIKISTRRLAKAQRTWFKRFHTTQWIDLAPDTEIREVAEQLIKDEGSLWKA